jgi:hypothetical protein
VLLDESFNIFGPEAKEFADFHDRNPGLFSSRVIPDPPRRNSEPTRDVARTK